jgi:hypothetical protein
MAVCILAMQMLGVMLEISSNKASFIEEKKVVLHTIHDLASLKLGKLSVQKNDKRKSKRPNLDGNKKRRYGRFPPSLA